MREYASIILNVIAYAGIYLEKQSPVYARILNVFDAVYSNYRDRDLFKMDCFAKRIMPQYRCGTVNFSGQKGEV